MDFTAFLLIIIAAGIVVAFFLLWKKSKEPRKNEDGNSFLLLQQQINQVSQILDSKLSESNKSLQQQFSQSASIIRDVTEKLTRLDETNKQVVGFADQLKSLQDVLKNPKQRGILGEYYLETVLKNVLPPNSFQMQYSFLNGEIVDAVVKIDNRIIPIDSKFSLDNYNRMIETRDATERKKLETAFVNDLKLRIDETSKYVRPEEKTMDFAFMFIPSEAVYYDLLINKVGAITEDTNNLIYYAGKKKVVVVSPTSFLAYLQTVLQGLRAMQIEESAKDIRKRVEMLGQHIKSYDEYFKKLGGHLTTTVNTYNTAYKELNKIDKDVVKIAEVDRSIEPLILDKPKMEE